MQHSVFISTRNVKCLTKETAYCMFGFEIGFWRIRM